MGVEPCEEGHEARFEGEQCDDPTFVACAARHKHDTNVTQTWGDERTRGRPALRARLVGRGWLVLAGIPSHAGECGAREGSGSSAQNVTRAEKALA